MLSRGGESFSKKARLTRRSEYLRLSREGRRIHTSHFVVISKENEQGQSRLGITVSGKVGNAVVRNRVKRLLREFFRRHQKQSPGRQDIVIIAKNGAGELASSQVAAELRGVFAYRGSRQK